MSIRVVVADDQLIVREGFAALLETQDDITVVGSAADGEEAVRVCGEQRPDVVLMDVRMPGVDGIEATRRLRSAGSRAAVLVVTTFDLDDYVLHALRAGAAGFLLKASSGSRLAEAIRAVARGDSVLDPALTRRLIEAHLAQPEIDPRMARRIEQLTDREHEVWRLLVRGLSNAEMGALLHLSEATIKSHVTRLLGKLDVRNRVGAVVLAYDTGLVRAWRGATAGGHSS
jgi:DNA-binding NarL/FixJ family response regulator